MVFCSQGLEQHQARLVQHYSSKVSSLKDPEDVPIKYSESKANVYDSVTSFSSKSRKGLWTAPWYQRPIIAVSLFSLLLYGMTFREVNEWDSDFERRVYDSFPDMEEQDLKRKIKERQARGQDCTLEIYQLRELLRYRV